MIAERTAAAIDRHQVKTLLRIALKIDWRGSTNPFTAMQTKRSKFPGIVVVLGLNFVFSILFGILFIRIPSFFDGLVITAVGPMVMISLQILLEFGHIIISPSDYNVLTPHPVSSKTFYVAKLLHLLFYVTVLCLSLSLIPAIIAAIRYGSILAAPVLLIHYWLVGVFATALMMVLFTVTMRSVDRRRVERWMSYLQALFILIFYGGMHILPRSMEWISNNVTVDSLPWLRALPSYWYASWVGLIERGWSFSYFLYGLLGLGVLLLLGRIAVSYLSLSYARSLTDSQVKKTVRHHKLPPRLIALWHKIASPETRALTKLAWTQFKYDMQFRMQILWIIPVSLIMVVMVVVSSESLGNPFDADLESSGTGAGVSIIFGMIPMIVHMGMTHSKNWPAAWVFYAAPIDRIRIVLSVKRIAFGFFLFPGAVFLLGLFWWLFGSFLHAALHTFFICVVVSLGLTLINIVTAKLPFASEQTSSGFSGESFMVIFVTIGLLGVPIGLVSSLGYGGFTGWAVITGLALLLTIGLVPIQNKRIRRKISVWELTG